MYSFLAFQSFDVITFFEKQHYLRHNPVEISLVAHNDDGGVRALGAHHQVPATEFTLETYWAHHWLVLQLDFSRFFYCRGNYSIGCMGCVVHYTEVKG
jgi:hypothetical protein